MLRVCACRLYDTRDKALIEEFVDDVMELVELQPNRDALVRHTGQALPACFRHYLTVSTCLLWLGCEGLVAHE